MASTNTLHATAACTLLGRSTKTGSNTSSSGSAASTGTLRARRCCAAARTLLKPSTETGSNTSSSGSADTGLYGHIARCCCLHAARGPSTKTGSIVPPARPALLPPQAHSYFITSLLRARSAQAIDRDWFQRQLVRFCGLHRQLHAAAACSCTLFGPSTETGSNTSSSGSAASTGTLRDRRCCCSHAA
jgi:hypothetical protein